MEIVIIEMNAEDLGLLHSSPHIILEAYDKASPAERTLIYLMRDNAKAYRLELAKNTDKLEKIRTKP